MHPYGIQDTFNVVTRGLSLNNLDSTLWDKSTNHDGYVLRLTRSFRLFDVVNETPIGIKPDLPLLLSQPQWAYLVTACPVTANVIFHRCFWGANFV